MSIKQWYIIETEAEYKEAAERFEEIREAEKGTPDHREKLLLVHLISTYELKQWSLPKLNSEEMVKIRTSDFGYSANFCQQPTAPTTSFGHIAAGEKKYVLHRPVYFKVISFSEGHTIIENEALDIYAYGETMEEAKADLGSQFDYAYKRLGRIPNESLSSRLLAVKKYVNEIVKRVDE